MAAANDNKRRKRAKRRKTGAQHALATMTRIIQDIYGPDAKSPRPPNRRSAG
jgi:hypothetical protein